MVAHVLVIASTVQIEQNFKFLLHLRTYWSTLDRPMMQLRAFHGSCRKSMDTTFGLDRWMLRIFVEFAKPVEEKGAMTNIAPLTLDTTLYGISQTL